MALTVKQHIVICIIMVAAIVLQVHRDALPANVLMLPELLRHRSRSGYAGPGTGLTGARLVELSAWDFAKWQASGAMIALLDKPVLLVGDSLPGLWPWEVDRICLGGVAAPEIASQLPTLLGDRHYRVIVLWCGTHHLALGKSVESYAAAMDAMIGFAKGRAEQVVVMGPMPYDKQQLNAHLGGPGAVRRAPQLIDQFAPTTLDEAALAVAVVRRRHPEILVYDLRPFREAAVRGGRIQRAYRDGVHPSYLGYLAIATDLDRVGVRAY